ncbi:MAG TPA: ABC transporter substrate-binding protein [Ramlibacter sp.]|nr:ABC transporter substrate-binding protein [Ramlibacter sp.]HZY19528.1 ABC transporter substrate-binding protein [Ramlibacter sp.]
MLKSSIAACLVALAVVSGAPARAQLLIGQTTGFSGPIAAGAKENSTGAKLWIDAVNAKGGVNGQKIELIQMDDKFEPKLAAANAKTLIEEKNVLALFLSRGTPHNEAIMPLLEAGNVVLVAPSTGAMVLHEPVNRHIFNVRATYQREAERGIDHLAAIGMTRLAAVVPNDSFGDDTEQGIARAFQRNKLKPVAQFRADRANPEYAKIIPALVAGDAQAVLWIGTADAVAGGIKALRAAGSAAQVVTLSNNAAGGFVKALGNQARGVIVSQVFPAERSIGSPFVREAQELAKAAGLEGVTPAMLEGFAAAKVLVEGLRRAGKNPTRASLHTALESIRNLDLGGGLDVSFSPTDHTGLNYVELSIIGDDGKFKR